MAKYKLMTASGKTRLIECVVLDSIDESRQYLVEFSNGVQRKVPKTAVSDLDLIDEAIIDRLKDTGRKIGTAARKAGRAVVSAASKVWDEIVKVGKKILFSRDGEVIPAVSPINMAIDAETKRGLSFIPSRSLIDTANEAGIEISANVESDGNTEHRDAKMINQYWHSFIDIYNANKDIFLEESAKSKKNYRKLLLEAVKYKADLTAQKEYLEDEDVTNVSRDKLINKLSARYLTQMEASDKVHDSDVHFSPDIFGSTEDKREYAPYLIWGAPGIGKTQIVSHLVKSWNKIGLNCSFYSIDLSQMRFDDFMFPVVQRNERTGRAEVIAKFREKDLDEVTVRDVVKKGILPVFELPDPDDPNYEEIVRERDNICNGGGNGVIGDGGIIFMDEISRISEDLKVVLMTLLQKRTVGNDRYAIGSKWMFVGASNRQKDMNAAEFRWEQAFSGRFEQVNFVPKFEEWLVYAESVGVDDIILRFLRAHPEYWITVAENPRESDRVLNANPRAWMQISSAIKELVDMTLGTNKKRGKKNISFSQMTDATGTSSTKLGNVDAHGNISSKDYEEISNEYIYRDAAKAVADYAHLGKFFGKEDVDRIMQQGANAPVNVNALTPEGTINFEWPEFVVTEIFGEAMKRNSSGRRIKDPNAKEGYAVSEYGYDAQDPMPPKILRNIVEWFEKATRFSKSPADTENNTPYEVLKDWDPGVGGKKYKEFYPSFAPVLKVAADNIKDRLLNVGIVTTGNSEYVDILSDLEDHMKLSPKAHKIYQEMFPTNSKKQ